MDSFRKSSFPPSIGGVIGRAGDNAEKAEDALVLDAARLYFIEKTTVSDVTIGVLVDEGYLDARSDSDSLSSDVVTGNETKVYKTANGGTSLTNPGTNTPSEGDVEGD